MIDLQGIRDQGQVQPGRKVLINGAGGTAGMLLQTSLQCGTVIEAGLTMKKSSALYNLRALDCRSIL
jgi:hypothetical protein